MDNREIRPDDATPSRAAERAAVATERAMEPGRAGKTSFCR